MVTSSDGSNVSLTVKGYGRMTWYPGTRKFIYEKTNVAKPGRTITVISSGGGKATKNVTKK